MPSLHIFPASFSFGRSAGGLASLGSLFASLLRLLRGLHFQSSILHVLDDTR